MSRIHYLAIHEALLRLAEANHEVVNVVRDLVNLIDIGDLDESDEQYLQDVVAIVEKRTAKKLGSKILGRRIRVELYLWITYRNSDMSFTERS